MRRAFVLRVFVLRDFILGVFVHTAVFKTMQKTAAYLTEKCRTGGGYQRHLAVWEGLGGQGDVVLHGSGLHRLLGVAGEQLAAVHLTGPHRLPGKPHLVHCGLGRLHSVSSWVRWFMGWFSYWLVVWLGVNSWVRWLGGWYS